MSTLYALLVGIDKYQPPVPPLDGCVNDMRAFRDFLARRAQRTGLDFQPVILENDQATRLNIVQKFETHLRQAKKGDIAVFYYSGHGSQEPSHPVFQKIEDDGMNETFACYDSRQFDGMDIADKELATLLSRVSVNDPHLLVVTDCCNSGGNTRSVGLQDNNVKVRQSPEYDKYRDLDSYILTSSTAPQTRGLSTDEESRVVVPHSRHVHLAATHAHQLAKETHLGGSPRGVFTYSLLEILENTIGPVTYQDVIRRVRSTVRKRTFEQDPQLGIFVDGDDKLEFLNGSLTINNQYYNLEHSRETGWTMDAGTLHGIVAGNFRTGELALLNVFDCDATDADMQDPNKALGQVSVASAGASSSVVRLEGDLNLDTNQVYRARIHAMPLEQMAIAIRGNAAAVSLAEKALQEDDQASLFLRQVNRSQAEYHLIANEDNEYVIIRGTDADDQPLVKQIEGFSPETAQKAIDYLEHIAKRERTLALNNPNSRIFSNAVRIEVLPADEDTPIIPAGGNYEFSYREDTGEKPRFRIKVVNTSGRDLYCALLYMGSFFDINASFFTGKGKWIKNGGEAWAREGRVMKGSVDSTLYAMGRRSEEIRFKVVYSTKDFDASLMEQDELDKPKARTRSVGEDINSRGLLFDDNSVSSVGQDDWNATDISILFTRED